MSPLSDPPAVTYRAFLSYSHRDKRKVKRWHTRLETFQIDPNVVGRDTPLGPVPRSLEPICRDEIDLPGRHELTDELRSKLDQSAALIVMTSPSAAVSDYVRDEVGYFRARHPDRPVIGVILAGHPGHPRRECRPLTLRRKVDADGHPTDEPYETALANPGLFAQGPTRALAMVVGTIVGLEPTAILPRAQEHIRAEMWRHWRPAMAVSVLLLVVAGALGWWNHRTVQDGTQLVIKETQRTGEQVETRLAVIETTGASGDKKLDELLTLARAGGVFARAADQGIPEPAVRGIVERLGGLNIARDDLIPWLDNWIKHERVELDRHSNEGAAYDAAWRKAEAPFNTGRMAEVADPFMEEMRREEAREAERQAERRRKRVALLEAAIDFDTRALNIDAIPPKLRLIAAENGITDPDAFGWFLHDRADERYEHGRDKGDNTALLVAIATWRAALEELTRDRVPLDWAMTQNNLGVALSTLGARESGTARLEEAVAACRAALEEYTRDRVPLNWATTQNNLGIALQTLGARESGIARLE